MKGVVPVSVFLFSALARGEAPSVLRMPGYAKSVLELDPLSVETASDSKRVRWIFTKVIDQDEYGQIEGVLAETWRIQDGAVIFDIRKDAKTVSGQTVTAEDVAFSIRRLMVLGKGGGTHTTLDERLCQGKFAALDSPCSGLVVSGKWIVKLIPKNDPYSLLLDFLRSDLAIVPRGSVATKTLKIVDYKDTSGAYYYARKETDGTEVLKANPNWPLYSTEMPQELHFVPPSPTESGSDRFSRLFREGKIDFMDTSFSRQIQMELSSTVPGAQLLEHPIGRLSFVLPTPKARVSLSAERRRALQVSFQRMAREAREPSTRRENAETFLSPRGWGSLRRSDASKYDQLVKNGAADDGMGLGLSVSEMTWKTVGNAFRKHFPKMKFFVTASGSDGWDALAGKRDDIHFLLDSTDDAGGSGDGDFVYHAKQNTFAIPDVNVFLKNYVNQPEEKRKEMMAEVHFASLVEDPVVFPLFRFPRFVLLREPWVVESRFWLENPYRFRLRKK